MTSNPFEEPHLHEKRLSGLSGSLALSVVVVIVLSVLGWVAIGFAAKFFIS